MLDTVEATHVADVAGAASSSLSKVSGTSAAPSFVRRSENQYVARFASRDDARIVERALLNDSICPPEVIYRARSVESLPR